MSRSSGILGYCTVVVSIVVLVAACGGAEPKTPSEPTASAVSMQIVSHAFSEGSSIPQTYTCDGVDVSPPLSWSGVPPETKGIALIVDDPDAPGRTWVHWVLYAIPPGFTELSEGAAAVGEIAFIGAKNGTNDFNRLGYGGPCPPRGAPHRYFFKLYALDIELGLDAGVKKEELLGAMEGHILAEASLMGTYERR